jgi:hypothetical protein
VDVEVFAMLVLTCESPRIEYMLEQRATPIGIIIEKPPDVSDFAVNRR